MDISMNDINKLVQHLIKETGLDFTYDNRVNVLAGLAKGIAEMESIDPLDRISVSLGLTIEIVRLRSEKQIFES